MSLNTHRWFTAALLVAAAKGGLSIVRDSFQLLSEIPFDSNRKAMSVIVREADGGEAIYTKGAPEVVLAMCDREVRNGEESPLTSERRQSILQRNAGLADDALRVLALAYRKRQPGDGELQEKDLVLAGLAGMIDPPRDEAKLAVESCRSAGIRPVMIIPVIAAVMRVLPAMIVIGMIVMVVIMIVVIVIVVIARANVDEQAV